MRLFGMGLLNQKIPKYFRPNLLKIKKNSSTKLEERKHTANALNILPNDCVFARMCFMTRQSHKIQQCRPLRLFIFLFILITNCIKFFITPAMMQSVIVTFYLNFTSFHTDFQYFLAQCATRTRLVAVQNMQMDKAEPIYEFHLLLATIQMTMHVK